LARSLWQRPSSTPTSRRVIRKRKDRATADCPLDPSPLLLNAHGRIPEPYGVVVIAQAEALAAFGSLELFPRQCRRFGPVAQDDGPRTASAMPFW
jgi:hypothetical protein